MNKKVKNSEIYLTIFLIFCGLISLWLVISHIAHFSYPQYFYDDNPNITTYIGTNVVSMWADFSFFTYLTMLLFALWALLLGFSSAFKWEKVNAFLRKDSIVCFIFCNYLTTVIMYTVFELASGHPTFGWYANVPLSYHNVGTNILCHYVMFAFACIIFCKVKTIKTTHKACYIAVSVFLLIYYAVVKIVGEFAYTIRWFPYIIFDAKSLGAMFGITNYGWSVVLLIISCCLILCAYLLMYYLLLKYKNK